MKDYSRKLIGTTAAAILVALSGCASTTGSPTIPSSASSMPETAATGASALESAAGLYSSLGGANSVNALAQSFGSKLALNPSVTKFLDAAAIAAAKDGLKITIAALGGQPVTPGSADLLTALKGKQLDPAAIKGVSNALLDAGKEMNLSSEQLGALSSVMDDVSKALM